MPRTERAPLDDELAAVLQAVNQVLKPGLGVVVVLTDSHIMGAGGNLPRELMAFVLRNAADEVEHGQASGEVVTISSSNSKGD